MCCPYEAVQFTSLVFLEKFIAYSHGYSIYGVGYDNLISNKQSFPPYIFDIVDGKVAVPYEMTARDELGFYKVPLMHHLDMAYYCVRDKLGIDYVYPFENGIDIEEVYRLIWIAAYKYVAEN